MQQIFSNGLNGLATERGQKLQLSDSVVAQLRMDGRTLNGHDLILATVFGVTRTITETVPVQLEQGTALRPARLTNAPVQQFRDGRLGDANHRGNLALGHSVVEEVLND